MKTRIVIATLSALLLGAHFFRSGHLILTMLGLLAPILLFVRAKWASLILQMALILGSVEWIRTGWEIARFRIAWGQPWARMSLILATVTALTLTAALLVRREVS